MDSNYAKMAEQARKLFLQYDLEQLASFWALDLDEEALYTTFFSRKIRIDKAGGEISPAKTEDTVYFPDSSRINDTMVLYDLLTFPFRKRDGNDPPVLPAAAGRWESISTLGGYIGAGHDQSLNRDTAAQRFNGRIPQLKEALESLNGVPCGKADAEYRIPVFRDFGVLFQFWEGDEEFPARIRYLFDVNALSFMHYETLWYLMGCLEDRLSCSVCGNDGDFA